MLSEFRRTTEHYAQDVETMECYSEQYEDPHLAHVADTIRRDYFDFVDHEYMVLLRKEKRYDLIHKIKEEAELYDILNSI